MRIKTTTGTSGATIALQHGGEAGGRTWAILSAGSGNSAGVGKFSIVDASAGTARMSIDSAGRVGIGTTTPTAALHVDDTAGNTYAFRANKSGAMTVSHGAGLIRSDASYAGAAAIAKYGLDVQLDSQWNGNSYGMYVLNHASNDATVDGRNKYGISIDSYDTFTGGAGVVTNNYGLNIGNVSGADKNWALYSGSNVPSYFAGSVGIGTSAPNNALQVAGLVNFDDARSSTFLGRGTGTVNTGTANTAVGNSALSNMTTGTGAVAVGYGALAANTDQWGSVGIGYGALGSSNALANTAVGFTAASSTTTGWGNVAIGVAHRTNTTGWGNVAIGTYALDLSTTGSTNVAVGYNAGRTPLSVQGENDLVLIGSNAGIGVVGINNAVALGHNATVGCSNCIALGGSGVDAYKVGISTPTPGASLDIGGNPANAVRTAYLNVSGNNTTTADRPYVRGTTTHLVINGGGTTSGGDLYLNYTGDGATGNVRIRENLFVTGAGVGVGTVSPVAGVHITSGDAGYTTANFPRNLHLGPDSGGGAGITFPWNSTSGGRWAILANTNTLFFARTWWNGAAGEETPTYHVVLDSSGNMGVGTSGPTAKLDVVGDLKTSGNLIAEGNSWGSGTSWIYCARNASCSCPNGYFVHSVLNYFYDYAYGYIACALP